MAQRLAPDPALLAESPPRLAKVGLTFGNERLREQALETLAANVVDRLLDPPPAIDPNQLRLF